MKGQISELTLSILDDDVSISSSAKVFFTEFSKKVVGRRKKRKRRMRMRMRMVMDINGFIVVWCGDGGVFGGGE